MRDFFNGKRYYWRGVREQGEDFMITWIKIFSSAPFFKQVRDFSRENLPRIKDGPYVINLNDKLSKGTYWVSLFINRHAAVYFDSFGI